jgi:DNA-binding beta-propeller fold protein YncE
MVGVQRRSQAIWTDLAPVHPGAQKSPPPPLPMKKTPSLLAALSALCVTLTLPAQPNELGTSPAWHIAPGERTYLNSTFTSPGYLEQGIAYNRATGNLYVIHNSSSEARVHVLDGATGDDRGTLSVAGVSGGVRLLRKIGVTDDGVIYAGNVTTNAASDPYKLYRWRTEETEPEVVWSGDPSNGVAGVIRNYGANIAVRGSGNETQILIAPDFWQQTSEAHVVALFTTTDGGETFSPTFITTSPTTRFGLGTAFGAGDTFWGTRAGQPLREFSFQGTLLREFGGSVVTSGLSPIGIDLDLQVLVGIRESELWVYQLNSLSTQTFNTAMVRPFPSKNENVERTGDVAFGENLIFALDTNNGIVAYTYGPPAPPEPVAPGDIFWTTLTAIRTAEIDGSNPRTVIRGLQRPIGIDIDAATGHIYWAEDGNSVPGAARIMRARLDGTGPEELLSQRSMAQFLKVDPQNGRIYWAEFASGLYSSALDGTDVRHLIERPGNGQSTGVALDPARNHVYLGSAAGQLYRIPLNATGPVSPDPLTSLPANTYGITLNTDTNLLFGTTFSGGYAFSKNLDSPAQDPVTRFTGLESPLGISISPDKSQLVWVERTGGRIRLADTGSTTYQTILSGEDSPFGITFRPPAPAESGFATWIADFSLPTEERGPGDDPDGDGIPNLLEYALGLDPSLANRAALPLGETLFTGGQAYLMLEVGKNAAATDVQLIVESSADLLSWNSGPGHTVILEETASLLRVRDAVPVSESARRFLRLRAVQP